MENSFKDKIDSLLTKSVKPLNKISKFGFYSSILSIIIIFLWGITTTDAYDYYDLSGFVIASDAITMIFIFFMFMILFFYTKRISKNNPELTKKLIKWFFLILVFLNIILPIVTDFWFLEKAVSWILFAIVVYFSVQFFSKARLQKMKSAIKSFNDTNKKILAVGTTLFIIWFVNGLVRFTITLSFFSFFGYPGTYFFAIWFPCFFYLFLNLENEE